MILPRPLRWRRFATVAVVVFTTPVTVTAFREQHRRLQHAVAVESTGEVGFREHRWLLVCRVVVESSGEVGGRHRGSGGELGGGRFSRASAVTCMQGRDGEHGGGRFSRASAVTCMQGSAGGGLPPRAGGRHVRERWRTTSPVRTRGR